MEELGLPFRIESSLCDSACGTPPLLGTAALALSCDDTLTIVIPTGLVTFRHGGRIIAGCLPPQLVSVPVTQCQLPSLKDDSRTMAWVMSTMFCGRWEHWEKHH